MIEQGTEDSSENLGLRAASTPSLVLRVEWDLLLKEALENSMEKSNGQTSLSI